MPIFSSLRLPTGVYNTYRQYKADSQVIIKWVVSTSATLTLQGASSIASKTTSSKSKGNRGKRQIPSTDDRYAPAISLSRFLQLSQLIASSGTTVPKTILTLLAGTIRLRKRTAAFYSSDVDAWKSNSSHRKAIEILMEALQVLGGNELDEQIASLSLEDDGSGVESHGDTAANLVLPEASTAGMLDNEWIRDNPLVNPPGKKKKSSGARIYSLSEYKFIEDGDGNTARKASREAEVLFAVLCFFQDLGRLRDHCNKLWKSVKPAGDISRITAGFVTSEAVNVVKQLEYEV
ncbi:hypothetical protein BDD12DRAFT_17135 [Trichophaea hybrida]|nr:hypothetical protein BDD12DRAFT_17135 [Trichophaea hybrida]